VLEGVIAERGVPQAIRSDNGPEFTSRHFLAWCAERKIGQAGAERARREFSREAAGRMLERELVRESV
jgi:transposase InsO family protein